MNILFFIYKLTILRCCELMKHAKGSKHLSICEDIQSFDRTSSVVLVFRLECQPCRENNVKTNQYFKKILSDIAGKNCQPYFSLEIWFIYFSKFRLISRSQDCLLLISITMVYQPPDPEFCS